jgi:hypothetical protein
MTMALQKTVSDPTGVDVSYWIVQSFTVFKVAETGRIHIAGYRDEGTRQEHPTNGIAHGLEVTIPRAEFLEIYDAVVNGDADLYTEIYEYIKTNVDLLEGATDA